MPIYKFHCLRCNLIYQDLASYDETGKYATVACPKCESKRKEQRVTTCSFKFSNPEGTDVWNSDSQGHDYRYKTKQQEVREQRETAEKKSHMGNTKSIYKEFDDLNKDQNWDFSKI